jgi:hypothetical protein
MVDVDMVCKKVSHSLLIKWKINFYLHNNLLLFKLALPHMQ